MPEVDKEIYIDICPICGSKVKLYKGEIICTKCVVSFRYPRFPIFGNKLYVKNRKERYRGLRELLMFTCIFGFIIGSFLHHFQNIIFSIACLCGSISIFLKVYLGNKKRIIWLKHIYIFKRDDSLLYELVLFTYFLLATALFLYGLQLCFEEISKDIVNEDSILKLKLLNE